MKKYLLIAAVIIATFSISCLGISTPTVLAADCSGSSTAEVACGATQAGGGSTGPSLTSIASTVINILSIIVGLAAIIMIIIGGLKYVTSSGDASSVSSAKTTIIYAIVGLVVVALAQSLVHFVLNRLS